MNSVQPAHPSHPTTSIPLAPSYFGNAQGGTFIHPNFSTVGGNQINNICSNPHWVLQILWEAIAEAGASHDSAARYPLIGCHPNTRQGILEMLLKWARQARAIGSPTNSSYSPPRQDMRPVRPLPTGLSRLPPQWNRNPTYSYSTRPLSDSPFYWLYGPAGHGKSTIAQSLSEQCAREGLLICSFFFSRNDSKRNDPTYLFLTIAYGLASHVPTLEQTIGEIIQKDPAILRCSLDTQFRELIVKPCQSLAGLWESSWPRLVIIDGLDECQGNDMQEHILYILSSPYRETGSFPLRFLICSRPEPTIRETFDSSILYPYSQRTPLNNSWETHQDIKLYLADRLNTIRCKPKYSAIQFPDPWPPHGAIDHLAGKSGGQWVYVSTAVAFVGDSEFHNPCRRLEVILGLSPKDDNESPFGPVDALYRHVLSVNPSRKRLVAILGLILHPPQVYRFHKVQCNAPHFIEVLLDLPEGQANLELRAMHSVLDITNSRIHFPHASFSDFLHEKSRSGNFYIDPTYFESFATSCAVQYLNKCLRDPSRSPMEFLKNHRGSLIAPLWYDWSGMCRPIGHPTQELLLAIESLDLNLMYGVIIRRAIEDPKCQVWKREWRDLIVRIREVSSWLQTQNDIDHHVALKFSAALEGFHISLAAHSPLIPALRLLGVYLYTFTHGRHNQCLTHIVKNSQKQIALYRQEQAQSFHIAQCRDCTSVRTLAHAPTECSPGVFYVRVHHPYLCLVSSLIELIPSNFSLQAFSILLGPQWSPPLSLLREVGPLPFLLPPLLCALPYILNASQYWDAEWRAWSLVMWLKTFPEENKRQTPFRDILQPIKDWVLRTDTDNREWPVNFWYNSLRASLADPHHFPQS